MPLNPDERALHQLAITRIETGELPRAVPKNLWGGNGEGDPCALCGKRINQDELEYEVQDAADRVFHFHLRCHAIWQLAMSAASADASRPTA